MHFCLVLAAFLLMLPEDVLPVYLRQNFFQQPLPVMPANPAAPQPGFLPPQQVQQQQLCTAHEDCAAQFLCFNGACQAGIAQQSSTCTTDTPCVSTNAAPVLCKSGVCYNVTVSNSVGNQQIPFPPMYPGNMNLGAAMYCSNGGQPFFNAGGYPVIPCMFGQNTNPTIDFLLPQSQCPPGSTCDPYANICCTQPQPHSFYNSFHNFHPHRPWFPFGNPYQYGLGLGFYQNIPISKNPNQNIGFPYGGNFYPQQQNQYGNSAGAGSACEIYELFTGQICSSSSITPSAGCPPGSYCRVVSGACCRPAGIRV